MILHEYLQPMRKFSSTGISLRSVGEGLSYNVQQGLAGCMKHFLAVLGTFFNGRLLILGKLGAKRSSFITSEFWHPLGRTNGRDDKFSKIFSSLMERFVLSSCDGSNQTEVANIVKSTEYRPNT